MKNSTIKLLFIAAIAIALLFGAWTVKSIQRLRNGTNNIAALAILNQMNTEQCGDTGEGFLVCYHGINERLSKLESASTDYANRIDGLSQSTQLTDHLLGQDLDALKLRVEKLEKLHNKKLKAAECIGGQK